jgi:cobalt-zinc-cadmium efflux system membrane fusion protein
VQPAEEYVPLLRERLQKHLDRPQNYPPITWHIRFQSDGADAKPLELPILQIAPAIDPTQYTPMVMGYLPNENRKYLIGQFVTATIFVPPDPDTVEIPTSALNEVGGEALVFVETNPKKREFVVRRVAVVHRFKDVTIVRSELTDADLRLSNVEKAKGRRPLEPLRPGEPVVARGIVEMTTCLDTLAVKDQVEKLARDGK